MNYEEVIALNQKHINRMKDNIAKHETDECPKCGGPANPTLVATWGHCIRCQNAEFMGGGRG